MDFKQYQKYAVSFAIYPKEMGPSYVALGIGGEAGEVLDKIKKVYRDNNGVFDHENVDKIKYELGDILWYIANMCDTLGINIEDVASSNIEKLSKRKENNTINGSGDIR